MTKVLDKSSIQNQNTVLCSVTLSPKIVLFVTMWKNIVQPNRPPQTPIQGLSKRFEHHLLWPPRSPDLTPCDFFLWGYVKDKAYKPPLPQNVRELQDRIRAAVQTIDGNMLKRVWQERLSY